MSYVYECRVLVYLSPLRPSRRFLASLSVATSVVVFNKNFVKSFEPRRVVYIDPLSPNASSAAETALPLYNKYIKQLEFCHQSYSASFVNTYWSYSVLPFYYSLLALSDTIRAIGPHAVIGLYAPFCDSSAKIPIQGIASFESPLRIIGLFEACLASLIMRSSLKSQFSLVGDVGRFSVFPVYKVFNLFLACFHSIVVLQYIIRLLFLRLHVLIAPSKPSSAMPSARSSLAAVIRTGPQLAALKSWIGNGGNVMGLNAFDLLFTPQFSIGNPIKDIRLYKAMADSLNVYVPNTRHVALAAIDTLLASVKYLFLAGGPDRSIACTCDKFGLLYSSSFSLHSDSFLIFSSLFYSKLAMRLLEDGRLQALLVVENVGFYSCIYAAISASLGLRFNLLQSTVISPLRKLPLFPVADMFVWMKSAIRLSSLIGFRSAGSLSFCGSPFPICKTIPESSRSFCSLVYFSQPYRPEEELQVVSSLSEACRLAGIEFSISLHPRQTIAALLPAIHGVCNQFYVPSDYVLRQSPIVVTRTSSVALSAIASALPVFHCCFSSDMTYLTSHLDSCVTDDPSLSNLILEPESVYDCIFGRGCLHSFALNLHKAVLGS
jgi:hypothetical protein